MCKGRKLYSTSADREENSFPPKEGAMVRCLATGFGGDYMSAEDALEMNETLEVISVFLLGYLVVSMCVCLSWAIRIESNHTVPDLSTTKQHV